MKNHKKYNEIYVTIEANTWRRLTNFSLVIWIRKWHPLSLMSNSNQLVHNGLFCHYRGIDDSLKSNYLQCTTNLIHACTDHFLLVILGVHARCILSALRVGPWDVVRHCHGLGTERERLYLTENIGFLLNPRDHITQKQVVRDDWWLACSKLYTLVVPLLLVMLKVQDCKVDRFKVIKKGKIL